MTNETPNNTTPQNTSKTSAKKPVIIYIMILFIAAFLMMALSFAMHQRSNQEALGDLETSFHATIAEIQETQERILELEKSLDAANDQILALESDVANTATALQNAELEANAMEALYILQQKYSAGSYEECLAFAEQMENTGLSKALSPIPITTEDGTTITAPYSRYLQFKEACENKLADTSGETMFWS
jgi:uroporphyrin-3 C-methyltransferase